MSSAVSASVASASVLAGAPLRRLAGALAWLAALGMAASALAGLVVPGVTGATPYLVLSGSMEPTLSPGDLVVVRPVPPAEVAVGSVVTFQPPSGVSGVVTHRVVAVGVDGRGERVFRTRGDANGAVDVQPVREDQIRGEMWYAVPYLGHVAAALPVPARRVLLVGLSAGLLGYAAWLLLADRHLRHGAGARRDGAAA